VDIEDRKKLLANAIKDWGEKGKRGKGERGKNLSFLLLPVFPARLKVLIDKA
jgi:hypothetical protein